MENKEVKGNTRPNDENVRIAPNTSRRTSVIITEEQALLPVFGSKPAKERPTLEEVREAIRKDPGLPCKKLAEYLGLSPSTPITQQ